MSPPLVCGLVRHGEEVHVGVLPAVVVASGEELEPLAVLDQRGFGMPFPLLDEGQVAVRVRTELLRIVVERGADLAHGSVRALGVLREVVDADGHVAVGRRTPRLFAHR
jgi:hypothetical protein